MIPQTLTAWNTTAETTVSDADTNKKAYLEIDCVLSKDGVNKLNGTAYIPFSGTFEKGNIQHVKINIGKNALRDANGQRIVNE